MRLTASASAGVWLVLVASALLLASCAARSPGPAAASLALRALMRAGKLAWILHLEGAEQLAGSPEALRSLHELRALASENVLRVWDTTLRGTGPWIQR